MPDVPPDGHAVFWEAIKPWIQGGIGSFIVGTGVALRWLYGTWRARHKDQAAAEEKRISDSVLARAQLSAEQTLMFDRLNADNIGLRERNKVLEAEKRALERECDRWADLARAWNLRAREIKHNGNNMIQALVLTCQRAGLTVPPEYTVQQQHLPRLEEIETRNGASPE